MENTKRFTLLRRHITPLDTYYRVYDRYTQRFSPVGLSNPVRTLEIALDLKLESHWVKLVDRLTLGSYLTEGLIVATSDTLEGLLSSLS